MVNRNGYFLKFKCLKCLRVEYVSHYVDGQFCHKHGGVLYLLKYIPYRPTTKPKRGKK